MEPIWAFQMIWKYSVKVIQSHTWNLKGLNHIYLQDISLCCSPTHVTKPRRTINHLWCSLNSDDIWRAGSTCWCWKTLNLIGESTSSTFSARNVNICMKKTTCRCSLSVYMCVFRCVWCEYQTCLLRDERWAAFWEFSWMTNWAKCFSCFNSKSLQTIKLTKIQLFSHQWRY